MCDESYNIFNFHSNSKSIACNGYTSRSDREDCSKGTEHSNHTAANANKITPLDALCLDCRIFWNIERISFILFFVIFVRFFEINFKKCENCQLFMSNFNICDCLNVTCGNVADTQNSSWQLYQEWCTLPESVKDTWIQAGQFLKASSTIRTANRRVSDSYYYALPP